MPNYVSILAHCSGGHDFDVDKFNESEEEKNFCEILHPVPEELKEICCGGCTLEDGTRVENWREVDGKDVAVNENELVAKYGHANWYDWQVASWGIKWGCGSVVAHDFGGDNAVVGISFECAWGPPSILDEIREYFKKKYDFDEVSFVIADPGSGAVTFVEDPC